MENKDLIELGFKPIEHFTITDSHNFDLGRNRYLSTGCIGTPNEMIFICYKDKNVFTDIICLHNFDYDGYLTVERLKLIINTLTETKTVSNGKE